MTPPEIRFSPAASFVDTDKPSLSIRTLKGLRFGWPLGTLASWEYCPATFVPGVGGSLEQVEELVIIIGYFPTKRKITVHGLSLNRIADVLDLGSGGVLVEQGSRFRGLAKPNEPFVGTITMEEIEEDKESVDPEEPADDGLQPPEDE